MTAAKWIDSWARLHFQFYLNLFSCLQTTNLSQGENKSRAGLRTLFNFRRNCNRQWILVTFHVYSRYLAATRDVHSTATGCKWLTFRFTTMMQRNQSAYTTWNLTFVKTGLKLHKKKKVIAFVLENYRIRDKYVQKNTCTHSEKIKVHLPMVKGKRNGLTFTECSVKVCRFLLLSLPF